MSKHWRPEHKVEPLRRQRWTRSDAHRPTPRERSGLSGTTIAVVLGAAACVGLTVGMGWRDEAAAPAGVEAVAAPGIRTSFDLCHSGGGFNCVVDGDTLYLNGEKVRIAGIDAPETHDFLCPSEKALGDRATAELHALLNSGVVTMTSIDRDRDRYGRLLRNVAVDGTDVGEALISAGLAREYGSGRRGWC